MSIDAFIAFIRQRIQDIRACEDEAERVLHGPPPDETSYRALMRHKAETLAALAGEAGTLLSDLPPEERDRLLAPLRDFSRNAQTALRLGSVFYMSALLYPDEYQKGEPNNLELYLKSV